MSGDIEQWLEALGLGRYAEAFADNEIGLDALPHLTEDDLDQGVDVLKLLDGFLTPTEGAALKESARGVFRAKLQKLGVQFSLFVTEKKWTQALELGNEIIAEFPNSRMAQEVRERLQILHQRATN